LEIGPGFFEAAGRGYQRKIENAPVFFQHTYPHLHWNAVEFSFDLKVVGLPVGKSDFFLAQEFAARDSEQKIVGQPRERRLAETLASRFAGDDGPIAGREKLEIATRFGRLFPDFGEFPDTVVYFAALVTITANGLTRPIVGPLGWGTHEKFDQKFTATRKRQRQQEDN